MNPTDNDLREVVRVLRQPEDTTAQRAAPEPPVPAPQTATPRCGCRVPRLWDARYGLWRHLDDLSACDPDRPRRRRR